MLLFPLKMSFLFHTTFRDLSNVVGPIAYTCLYTLQYFESKTFYTRLLSLCLLMDRSRKIMWDLKIKKKLPQMEVRAKIINSLRLQRKIFDQNWQNDVGRPVEC